MHRLLAAIMVLLVLLGGSPVTLASIGRAPAATVAYFNFTPTSGGAGTAVHLIGGQYYNPKPINVYISKADWHTTGYVPQPPSKPLATVQAKGGDWEAT